MSTKRPARRKKRTKRRPEVRSVKPRKAGKAGPDAEFTALADEFMAAIRTILRKRKR